MDEVDDIFYNPRDGDPEVIAIYLCRHFDD